MNVPIDKIIEKAADALSDAEFNFQHGRYEAAINRAYYTIFYSISALLEAKQISTKTHQGTHNKFNEIYLKSGLLPLELNTCLDVVFPCGNLATTTFGLSLTKMMPPLPSKTLANSSPPPKPTFRLKHDTSP